MLSDRCNLCKSSRRFCRSTTCAPRFSIRDLLWSINPLLRETLLHLRGTCVPDRLWTLCQMPREYDQLDLVDPSRELPNLSFISLASLLDSIRDCIIYQSWVPGGALRELSVSLLRAAFHALRAL